jgi:hypothetical protein
MPSAPGFSRNPLALTKLDWPKEIITGAPPGKLGKFDCKRFCRAGRDARRDGVAAGILACRKARASQPGGENLTQTEARWNLGEA